MNVPHELSDTLWQLAESQDHKKIDAFLKQHPELKTELQARINMISGIKGAKPATKKTTERFMPSARPLSSGPPRWAAALAATVLMAGAVFATLGTLKFIESQNSPPKAITPNQIKPLAADNSNTDRSQTDNRPPIDDTYIPQPDPNTVPPLVATKAIENRVTIVARQITLSSALNDIGLQAGIKLNSAPGMPDPTISIDFRDVPAIEVLKSLGAKLGFTPLEETDTSILLIPARDPNAPLPNSLPGFVDPANDHGTSDSGLLPVIPRDANKNNSIRGNITNEHE